MKRRRPRIHQSMRTKRRAARRRLYWRTQLREYLAHHGGIWVAEFPRWLP